MKLQDRISSVHLQQTDPFRPSPLDRPHYRTYVSFSPFMFIDPLKERANFEKFGLSGRRVAELVPPPLSS